MSAGLLQPHGFQVQARYDTRAESAHVMNLSMNVAEQVLSPNSDATTGTLRASGRTVAFQQATALQRSQLVHVEAGHELPGRIVRPVPEPGG
jgi:hypothetical protein